MQEIVGQNLSNNLPRRWACFRPYRFRVRDNKAPSKHFRFEHQPMAWMKFLKNVKIRRYKYDPLYQLL